MVPISRNTLFLNVFADWQTPIILCARTQLGTINHTLLSLRALQGAGCSVVGVAFIGEAEPEVEQTICDFGNTRNLGRLPVIEDLTPEALKASFSKAFDFRDLI